MKLSAIIFAVPFVGLASARPGVTPNELSPRSMYGAHDRTWCAKERESCWGTMNHWFGDLSPRRMCCDPDHECYKLPFLRKTMKPGDWQCRRVDDRPGAKDTPKKLEELVQKQKDREAKKQKNLQQLKEAQESFERAAAAAKEAQAATEAQAVAAKDAQIAKEKELAAMKEIDALKKAHEVEEKRPSKVLQHHKSNIPGEQAYRRPQTVRPGPIIKIPNAIPVTIDKMSHPKNAI